MSIKSIIEGLMNMMHEPFYIGLIVVVVFDYITGVAKALVWKVGDSSVGLKGLIKHSIVMVFITLTWVFSMEFQFNWFATTITLLYIFNYLISILENFSVMGIYQPKFLKNKIESEINRYEEQLQKGLTSSELKDSKNKVKVSIEQSIKEVQEVPDED